MFTLLVYAQAFYSKLNRNSAYDQKTYISGFKASGTRVRFCSIFKNEDELDSQFMILKNGELTFTGHKFSWE